MAGRKPLPTKLHILNGNPSRLNLEKLTKREPKPQPVAPKCPTHLGREGKKEWKRVVPELESVGLLTKIDMAALAGYCSAWDRWVEAETMIRKHGMLIKSPNGYQIASPYIAIANRSMDQMKAFLVEFGMTPSSRSRMSVTSGADESDEMSSLLAKRGRKSAAEKS